MKDMGQKFHRNLRKPDEVRAFKARGKLEIVKLEDGLEISRATFEPGWSWKEDVKPIAGTETCQEPHQGYCVSGRMRIRMDNGDEFFIEPGDAFSIPPGHEGFVEGNEPCVLITAGPVSYAKPAQLAA